MPPSLQLQTTSDGSHTLFVPALNEHYHSINGALQESLHIFIEYGLRPMVAQPLLHEYGLRPMATQSPLRVLEIGFGAGLNAFLTLREAQEHNLHILYHAIELHPLPEDITNVLNYGEHAWAGHSDLFRALHAAPWNQPVNLTPAFTLHKIEGDCNRCDFPPDINLIYFDAFAPDKQPEMWTQQLFDRLYACAAPAARLVTYCAKGEVRRRMQSAGFAMQRLPGPPGKRHILRGAKNP